MLAAAAAAAEPDGDDDLPGDTAERVSGGEADAEAADGDDGVVEEERGGEHVGVMISYGAREEGKIVSMYPCILSSMFMLMN